MFLPLAQAMSLRRDVCLWHVADYICQREALCIVFRMKYSVIASVAWQWQERLYLLRKLYLFPSYILAVAKAIFRLSAEVKVNP